jgi:hypothetical protein
VFVRAFAVSYLYSRDISRHSLNGLTFCHLSVQNYTGFATYAGSTKRPLFLKQWEEDRRLFMHYLEFEEARSSSADLEPMVPTLYGIHDRHPQLISLSIAIKLT